MNYLPNLTFRKPRLAVCALIVLVFCAALLIAPHDFVQKFAWLVSLGFGLGFFGAGAKYMQGGAGNLGVLMFGGGCALILGGIVLTPAAVFAASALEDAASPIVGAAMGYFIADNED